MTEEGFVKAQSDNLPKVDAIMIAEFFASSINFTAAEIRGIKAQSAGRDSYGDSAIGYVQIKRVGNICTIKARICPEHKVRNKNYNVVLEVDELEEKVLNVNCTDCAASEGGCKHAIAFITWVHRRSEEPSPTSTQCYWKKPKLAGVGTAIKYITVKEFGEVKKHYLPNPSNGSFLQKFIETGKQKGISSQILKYYTENYSLSRLGLHQLFSSFVREGGKTYDDFKAFTKVHMTTEDCNKACQATIDQSNCKLWHELHYGRITASRLYKASRCKTVNGTFVETIIGSLTIPETNSMKRGKCLEKKVIRVLEKQIARKLHPIGLLLSPDHPYLGASPDAITEDFVVEIKCPSSVKTISTYIKDSKITNKFNAQIQLQMYLFKKKKGIFCVADPNFEVNGQINTLSIDFNEEFIDTLITSAQGFWCTYIFPILIKAAFRQ